MRTGLAAVLFTATLLSPADPADAFRVTFDLKPIREVERSADDHVTVTYLSGEAVRAPRVVDFRGTAARLEVFATTSAGLKVSDAERRSFLSQIVVLLRPIDEAAAPRRWVGRQIYTEMRIEIVHAEPGLGVTRIGPKPAKDKAALPRLDTAEVFRSAEFKEIVPGSNRWIWVDTPRLPAVDIPGNGFAFAQSPSPALADKVRVHAGERLKLRRRFAAFLRSDAVGFRVDWSQELEVRVAARREEWRGMVALGTVHATAYEDDPELARAIRNGAYTVDDGQNQILQHPCYCETITLPRDP